MSQPADIISDATKAVERYERQDFDRFDDLCLTGFWVKVCKILLEELMIATGRKKRG